MLIAMICGILGLLVGTVSTYFACAIKNKKTMLKTLENISDIFNEMLGRVWDSHEAYEEAAKVRNEKFHPIYEKYKN